MGVISRAGGTLQEVARRCSVSQSTVSRVLNNSNPGRFSVSTEVKERILRVARELNYRPSMAARNLTVGKTHLVAVLGVRSIWSERVGPMERAVGAMAEVLDTAGYEICLQFLSRRHSPFDLPQLRVDGVVVVGVERLEGVQGLEDARLPYVSLDGVVGRRGGLVAPDDSGGTQLALEHLVGLGHRRIAYLDHPAVNARHISVVERRAAFWKGRATLGFEVPELNLNQLGADVPWDTYYEPFVRRAIIQGGATAVLAYSHHGAMSLLRTAHDLGLSVPRDFSLVCFNDEPVVSLSVPSLTAVDVQPLLLGRACAEMLLRRMRSVEQSAMPRVRVPEALVARESTAPPPRS